MSTDFVEAFIEKLLLLEQKTGAAVSYRMMDPFTAPFHDYISIQNSAKKIADFIGLQGYTFVVAVVKQKEKVAGHIELGTGSKDVFIEIDPGTMEFPDSVGATLCHEVCHKWLHVKRISSPIEYDNEILTDITTIFLGFGKIMLNGCKAENVRHETIPNGTQTITETRTSGYLDRDQLAFVYRLVCAMRNIPAPQYIRGLNSEAVEAIHACDSSFGPHYDSHYHREETTAELVKRFHTDILTHQRTMADLDKHLAYMKKAFCETINSFLRIGHEKLESLRKKAAAMTRETEHDPAMRFLRAIQRERELQRMSNDVNAVGRESEQFLKHAASLGRHLCRSDTEFPVPSSAMFTVVTCPQDGTKIRLPEDSGEVIATCPTCNYRFPYNT